MDCNKLLHHLTKLYIPTSFGLLIVMSMWGIFSKAQVMSPELRRVSVATNQFGFDALKALDRIEPPDKVLVFCPACISSSLMMIMMGSSKYQVVSSLRHALYVWSMKPQDINRGFKDIFDHIGFNQKHPPSSRYKSSQTFNNDQLVDTRKTITYEHSHKQTPSRYVEINEETRSLPMRESASQRGRLVKFLPINLSKYEGISLPALIRAKELLERRQELDRPWWHSISRRSQDKPDQWDSLSSKWERVNWNITNDDKTSQKQSMESSSQISALSNIYIQRGLNMNYNYNLLLRHYYKTVIHPVDFLANSEETRLHINSVVASGTENKIKDLIKKGSLDLKLVPRILMISTFHFRGTLDLEMKPRNRTETSSGKAAQPKRIRRENSSQSANSKKLSQVNASQFIETESSPLKYGHFSSLGCTVIEIPFDNRLVTLVIVMPDHKNSTDLLLTKLSAQILTDMTSSLVVKRLSLGIPVIKFDRGPINMVGLLRELGLADLFFGNRSYTTETGLNRWLNPGDIVHETSIDIGTINPDWTQSEDRVKIAHDGRNLEANHLMLDKPFFYFVMNSLNSLILTMGRIRQ